MLYSNLTQSENYIQFKWNVVEKDAHDPFCGEVREFNISFLLYPVTIKKITR